jgi:hypothetical protein
MLIETTFLNMTLTQRPDVHSQERRFEVHMAASSRGNTHNIGSHAHGIVENVQYRVCYTIVYKMHYYSATVMFPKFPSLKRTPQYCGASDNFRLGRLPNQLDQPTENTATGLPNIGHRVPQRRIRVSPGPGPPAGARAGQIKLGRPTSSCTRLKSAQWSQDGWGRGHGWGPWGARLRSGGDRGAACQVSDSAT